MLPGCLLGVVGTSKAVWPSGYCFVKSPFLNVSLSVTGTLKLIVSLTQIAWCGDGLFS